MMSFLRNLTIRARLFLLTALLCIFTAAASWVGYTRLVVAGEELNAMYEKGLLPIQWLNDSRTNTQAIIASQLNPAFPPTPNQPGGLTAINTEPIAL